MTPEQQERRAIASANHEISNKELRRAIADAKYLYGTKRGGWLGFWVVVAAGSAWAVFELYRVGVLG